MLGGCPEPFLLGSNASKPKFTWVSGILYYILYQIIYYYIILYYIILYYIILYYIILYNII